MSRRIAVVTLGLSPLIGGCEASEPAGAPPSASITHGVDPSLALPSSLPPPSRADERRAEREALPDSPDLETFLSRAEGLFGDEHLERAHAALPGPKYEGAELLEVWAHEHLTFSHVANGAPVGPTMWPGRPGSVVCLESDRFVIVSATERPQIARVPYGSGRGPAFGMTLYVLHAFGDVPAKPGPFPGRFCGVYTGKVFRDAGSEMKIVGMFDTKANRERTK